MPTDMDNMGPPHLLGLAFHTPVLKGLPPSTENGEMAAFISMGVMNTAKMNRELRKCSHHPALGSEQMGIPL